MLPPMMMSVWRPRLAVSPTASSAPVVARERRDPQPAEHEHGRQPEQGERSEQAELLGDRGEDEVGVDERDGETAAERDQALPEPLTEDAAAAERIEGADRLEAGTQRIGERVEPDVDAVLDWPKS